MSPNEVIGAITVAVVLIFVVMRVPIGIAMGVASFGGIALAISPQAALVIMSCQWDSLDFRLTSAERSSHKAPRPDPGRAAIRGAS